MPEIQLSVDYSNLIREGDIFVFEPVPVEKDKIILQMTQIGNELFAVDMEESRAFFQKNFLGKTIRDVKDHISKNEEINYIRHIPRNEYRITIQYK